jgi:PII-like signaling protein
MERGPAKKVTIYVNEDARHRHLPLHDALMGYLLHHGVAGATATRALSGFGSQRVLHSHKVEALAQHLPIRLEFVESAEKVDALLPTLYDMVADGFIEVQDTTVIKAPGKRPAELPHQPVKMVPAKMLRVFFGEADQWEGEPLHEAIVKKLRMLEIAGATVYRGIHGYGAKGHEHKRSFFHLSRDLPIMIAVVDTPERIQLALDAVASMLDDGLIAVSDTSMIRLVRSAPPPVEVPDDSGRG